MSYADFLRAKRARAAKVGRAFSDADIMTAPTPDLAELRGKDLARWCPLEDEHGNRVPCHADVLLELANPGWTP